MTPAIETVQLQKTFGATRAVDGIDLSVRRGSVYGLLGPNGAGKITTIHVLTTLLKPDGGTARVCSKTTPVSRSLSTPIRALSGRLTYHWIATSLCDFKPYLREEVCYGEAFVYCRGAGLGLGRRSGIRGLRLGVVRGAMGVVRSNRT
jgi:energy-coupling factor transporter ATP-binding protein EcfA2